MVRRSKLVRSQEIAELQIFHSCIDLIREYTFSFCWSEKMFFLKHLQQQHKLQEKEYQSSMRLWNILWSMYFGRPRSFKRFSTWSRRKIYFNRSRNKHSLMNTTGIAGKQKNAAKICKNCCQGCQGSSFSVRFIPRTPRACPSRATGSPDGLEKYLNTASVEAKIWLSSAE